MAIGKQDVEEALRGVTQPGDGKDVVSAGRIEKLSVCDGYVTVRISPGSQETDEQTRDVLEGARAAIGNLGDQLQQVSVELGQGSGAESPSGGGSAKAERDASGGQEPSESNPLPDVKHIVAVGAGKGGVGKTAVAVNLAVGLARAGHRVGLMDGDIYGPSTPTMLGLGDMQAKTADGTNLLPFESHGVKAMTIGKLVEQEKPLIWRGPMAHGAFRQLATQTMWGALDYLIIDLPPGTGDVPLTMSQLLPLTGAIVVCTPQQVAQDDARRAVRMFEQLEVPVAGIVENMSYFVGDDGTEYDIFGRGGAADMAKRMGVPLMGTLPLQQSMRANSDAGDPTANFTAGDTLSRDLESLVESFVDRVTAMAMEQARAEPTIEIE